ncbi:hypothetical protein IEQ11_04270 [Lysobacter capsici]|jgi:hypothetical protein|uniref:Uncharacterized protein n=1 Tax=Lysobacter capsici AZ78 TaxID=1444315 RepID=A0A108U8M7_9GAMM|nr:hypothetical protein [Lysobacter capsici]ALN84262.1 hypothetical protein LC55x_0965 [Lysobacter capsici]KWS04569.1 hypothetical protein AZ78_2119 [Lysobacter capsici AZ78]UOF15886.1 hypothetical protein IEQ11_04270 [Lysobacter capsici]WND81611.1 hypothetical protein RJ610_04330 [Lysobacter capsici]WND86807.1 hypothetical protein RJ609_04330 [Lysobacter capsici]
MKGKFLPLLLLVPSLSAFADQCDDNFTKKGNPITGGEYSTSVKVAGLSTASAIGQMRNIAIGNSMQILDEDLQGGSLLVEEPASAVHRPLPISISATADGEVSMVLKTRKGSFGNAGEIKKAMCGMLTQLKPGKTAPPRAAAAAAKPIAMSATALATEVEQQAKENVAVVDTRYKGRVYTLKGVNKGVTTEGGILRVFYDMNPSLIPGLTQSRTLLYQTRVMCKLASDQKGYALSLRTNDRINLTGTFDYYEDAERLVILKDCRAAK